MSIPKVAFICGTRPDAIKTAPVVVEMRKSSAVESLLFSTGQHREMLAQALDAFGLKPDEDLQIMAHGQSLAQVTTRALEGLDQMLERYKPDMVVAQGDTTTTFVASLAAFYRQIPFAHIEAGLRTDSIDNPFPEEFNRRGTALITKLHFAPTKMAADNLRAERVTENQIFVTGNTGIDALLTVATHSKMDFVGDHRGRTVLLTTHRRENWGEPQAEIARACLHLANEFQDTLWIVPMHKNPTVREVLQPILGGHPRIRLIEPPDYMDFVRLMQQATLILTDSGGVQEEAPSFGKPVLVLRDTTERPEGVSAGVAKLIGTKEDVVFGAASELLNSDSKYAQMANAQSPYGDGRASARIRYQLLKYFGMDSEAETEWTF